MRYYRNVHFARSAQHLSFPAWAVHRIKSSAGWHRRGACQHIQRAVLFFGEAQAASMGVDVIVSSWWLLGFAAYSRSYLQ
jgi:hypothetical protein